MALANTSVLVIERGREKNFNQKEKHVQKTQN